MRAPGVLGFMAQKLGATEVHLIERGPVIELAARLAEANSIPGLHLWQASSAEILDPPQVDVVVAEILGNLALEENALETLADARRFLKPGGTLIPARIEQCVAPVVNDRFWRELRSWDCAPMGLDFSAARAMSFDNLYVRTLQPADLLGGDCTRAWDALDFSAAASSARRGTALWELADRARIFGFALWWRCELVPGVDLTTSPFAAATHWEQVYAPVEHPLDASPGDQLEISLESETGGDESGIGMRWQVIQRRAGQVISRQGQDIGRGFIG